MKLLAPQNNWDMKSSGSWWPYIGSVPTAAGVNVSKESSLRLSAVFCCTRIISETMASLSLNLVERINERNNRAAFDHPLWSVLHDEPNPEQDIVSFIDMQVAFQLNWGNAYAEVVRDSIGNVKALWPIHPSRIPVGNIRRNARDPSSWRNIEAGQPGELVYYVRNDDGTAYPIPASDMLHIPGVLSQNGITGVSIIEYGANTIGIAMAKEQHAGAFFRNGAVSNIALKSAKTVGKEAAERLREQWQRVFAGVSNHYKTLILEDGMEPVPFSINPEAAQLLESQKFSVLDIARLYRMQPHKLGELGRAIQSNIESESQSFITDTMRPWLKRWEKALRRQLLTPEEKKTYRFKFNLLDLLRGDSAARSAFYTGLFNLGALSSNDIRFLEDMNPVDGGDQYFVPANNLVPLDKVGELAQAHIDSLNKAAEPEPVPIEPDEDDTEADGETMAVREHILRQKEQQLVARTRKAIAARTVGLTEYEVRAIRQAAKKPQSFMTWQGEFYVDFTHKLADALDPFNGVCCTFSARTAAEAYVNDSIQMLTPLAELPCSELESAANAALVGWTDRPRSLAEFLVPEGVEPCAV